MELNKVLAIITVTAIASAAMAQEDESPTFGTDATYGTDTTAARPRDRSGFFIEPVISYLQGDSSIETSDLSLASNDTSADINGAGLGLRIGGHMSEMFFLGADARYARLRITDSSYGNADGDSYNIGPVIGVQMPYYGFRFWGTYVAAGEYNPDSGNQGFNVKFEEAEGWRVGAGVRFASVSVNLEYQDLNYDNTNIQAIGGVTAGANADVDYDSNGYAASVSFPFEL